MAERSALSGSDLKIKFRIILLTFIRIYVYACVAEFTGRPGGSVVNLDTFWRWAVSSNLGVVTRTGIFPHKK